MSKQCKIVEDLLPLYHDGICSEESRQMVDEHLSQCEHCRKLLNQIDGELVTPAAKDADIKPLKKITRTVNKGKRKALIAGISATLAVLLLLFAGLSAWWYTWEYTYYLPFAEGQTPLSIHSYDENGNIGKTVVLDAGSYTWYDDTYCYKVDIPDFLSGSGHVSMTRLDISESYSISVSVSRWNDTKYVFHVSFAGTDYFSYDEEGKVSWPYFIVDSEMNQYFPDHWTDEVIEKYKTMLEEYKEEVQALVDDAMAMWPFIE